MLETSLATIRKPSLKVYRCRELVQSQIGRLEVIEQLLGPEPWMTKIIETQQLFSPRALRRSWLVNNLAAAGSALTR